MEIILKFKMPEEAEEYELFTNCHQVSNFVNDLNNYFITLTTDLQKHSNFSVDAAAKHFWSEFIRLRDEYELFK